MQHVYSYGVFIFSVLLRPDSEDIFYKLHNFTSRAACSVCVLIMTHAAQGSSGFRNACVTDTGAIGGKLLAVVTPKGLYFAHGQSSSSALGSLCTAYHSHINDRSAIKIISPCDLQQHAQLAASFSTTTNVAALKSSQVCATCPISSLCCNKCILSISSHLSAFGEFLSRSHAKQAHNHHHAPLLPDGCIEMHFDHGLLSSCDSNAFQPLSLTSCCIA